MLTTTTTILPLGPKSSTLLGAVIAVKEPTSPRPPPRFINQGLMMLSKSNFFVCFKPQISSKEMVDDGF